MLGWLIARYTRSHSTCPFELAQSGFFRMVGCGVPLPLWSGSPREEYQICLGLTGKSSFLAGATLLVRIFTGGCLK